MYLTWTNRVFKHNPLQFPPLILFLIVCLFKIAEIEMLLIFLNYFSLSCIINFSSSDEPKLTVPNLHSFPNPHGGEDIKIIARASVKVRQIGTMLLDDEHGNKVANIQSKTSNNEDAMHEIFCQWLREDIHPSWEKLVQCLRKCDCKPLADEINHALGKTQKGIITLSSALAIEIILLSLQMMMVQLLNQLNKYNH